VKTSTKLLAVSFVATEAAAAFMTYYPTPVTALITVNGVLLCMIAVFCAAIGITFKLDGK
jgi:hypothetical protein